MAARWKEVPRAAQTLASAQAKLPAPQPSARLADEITRLTRAIGEREELVKVLSDRLDISQNGLARFLEGLARQRVDGLWLTGVSVADGGRDIVIKGQALQPQLIPVLVQRLADEASFEGVKFRELRMHRPDGNAGRIEFELRTLGKAKTSRSQADCASSVPGWKHCPHALGLWSCWP